MNIVIPTKPSGQTISEFTAKKDNVVTVIATNVTLEGEQIQNGVSLVESDRVLLVGQTDKTENGIWVVGSGVYGPWSRPTDFNTGGEAAGTWTNVEQGTDNAGTIWFCYTNRSCIIDTTEQDWRNVNEDPVEGFNIASLTESSTNASGDFLAKHDGSGMKKIGRNDLLNPGTGSLTDGATVTINLASPERFFTVTLAGNRQLAIVNATPGDEFWLQLVQDGTGSRTVTWWSTINWAGGSAPTLTPTADKADCFQFKCIAANTYLCLSQVQDLGTSTGSGSVALGDGIVSYFKLDSGAFLTDELATTSLENGSPATGLGTGKINACALFSGVAGDTLRAPNFFFNFGDASFTIAFWMNGSDLSYWQTFVDNASFRVYVNPSSKVVCRITSSTDVQDEVTWDTALSDDTWYFIVCARDKDNSLLKISVNGGTYQTDDGGTPPTDTQTYFWLGSQNNQVQHFDGLLDEVGIWNRALTQAEVTELYNSGSGKSYPFT